MNRLIYLGWVLVAAAIFFPLLAFVLVNREPLVLDLLISDWRWTAPAGIVMVLALLIGIAIGFIAGFGARLLRGRAAGQDNA